MLEIAALAALALFVFLLVSRIAKRRSKATEPARQESPIERWARDEAARLMASRLELEEVDVQKTLTGAPDPEIVARLEQRVKQVETVYERVAGSRDEADVRVEVSFEDGKLERTVKRIAWSELPEHVKDELAKTGAAQVFRPWVFPWQR